MTYNAHEVSQTAGEPIELYEFNRGAQFWRFTSDAEEITYNSQTWTPLYHERGPVEQGKEINKSKLNLKVKRDHPIAWMFRIQPPGDIVTLTVYRMHRDDSEAVTIWIGRVTSVKWDSSNIASFDCEPIFTSLKRTGLRRLYQRACSHVLYGAECGVVAADHVEIDTPTTVNGASLIVAAVGSYSDGYFAGGFVLFEDQVNGYNERRMIMSHTGTTIILNTEIIGLTTTDSIKIYPGCDHALTTCDSKFSNSLNFGGFPFIPDVNPFGGAQIY